MCECVRACVCVCVCVCCVCVNCLYQNVCELVIMSLSSSFCVRGTDVSVKCLAQLEITHKCYGFCLALQNGKLGYHCDLS